MLLLWKDLNWIKNIKLDCERVSRGHDFTNQNLHLTIEWKWSEKYTVVNSEVFSGNSIGNEFAMIFLLWFYLKFIVKSRIYINPWWNIDFFTRFCRDKNGNLSTFRKRFGHFLLLIMLRHTSMAANMRHFWIMSYEWLFIWNF
jgi:hypothetical protein